MKTVTVGLFDYVQFLRSGISGTPVTAFCLRQVDNNAAARDPNQIRAAWVVACRRFLRI